MRTALLLALAACRHKDPLDEPIEPYDPLDYVDPFVATGGDGFGTGSASPGARTPFGMVQVGPDTFGPLGDVEFAHCAGYNYQDDRITAVAHTHAHGIGIADYGHLGVLPRDHWDPDWTADLTRRAPFSHERESARPGSYSVVLDDDGTAIELAATPHGAIHRYTFAGESPVVVVDLGHDYGTTAVTDARASFDGTRITGEQNLAGGYSGRFGGLRVHFVIESDPPATGIGGWNTPDAPEDGLDSADGAESGLWLQFPEGTTDVTLRVALSYVDLDGAIANYDAELDGRDFDSILADAESAWRAELGNVRVRGGTDAERVIFHTALFHAYQMPTLFSDVDGRYRGLDGEVHSADFEYHTDFSMWDTYRTLHPWLAAVRPDRQRSMSKSLVAMQRDYGSFDRWPMGYGATGGMVGSPSDIVLATSAIAGIADWDEDEAFTASLRNADGPVEPQGREAIASYLEHGYVAWDDSGGPAALTLEYAWADAALAAWAAHRSDSENATRLRNQSDSWANTWDPAQGFFVGRYADGTFTPEIDPEVWADDFVEGGAWQYLYMVPYDVPGLIDVQHGGDTDAFEARLRDFFAQSAALPDTALPDPIYWHGNEPDIHTSFMGSLAGRADATADASRWVLSARYAASPAGLDGNDDGGTLSAFYLWGAIGLFPVAGTPTVALGSPIFERTEIDLANGETLVIRADGASDSVRYVQSAELDGEPVDSSVLNWNQVFSGGELVLEMGDAPAGFGASR